MYTNLKRKKKKKKTRKFKKKCDKEIFTYTTEKNRATAEMVERKNKK